MRTSINTIIHSSEENERDLEFCRTGFCRIQSYNRINL